MELSPGYKRTEAGVLPKDWAALPVSQIGRIRGGAGFPVSYQGRREGDFPFYKVSDMNNEGNETFMVSSNHWISEDVRRRLGATVFPAGSIVFAKVGAAVFLERKKILSRPSCIDNNMAALVIDDEHASVRFFHYQLLATNLGDLVATTALPALSGKILGEMVLAVPPHREQAAIAAALSDVDALLAAQDALIAKKRAIKQSAMQELLSGRRRLPSFSGQWRVTKLKDIADCLKGFGLSKGSVSATGRQPCILYGELFTRYSQVVRSVDSRTDSGEGLKSIRGDILMPGSTTTCGEDLATASALLVGGVSLGGDINVIRRKGDSYREEFLAMYLTTLRRYEIAQLTQGITIHHLYGRELRELELELPELAEQSAIAEILMDMDTEIEMLEMKRIKTAQMKKGMMQELLTGRIRLV